MLLVVQEYAVLGESVWPDHTCALGCSTYRYGTMLWRPRNKYTLWSDSIHRSSYCDSLFTQWLVYISSLFLILDSLYIAPTCRIYRLKC